MKYVIYCRKSTDESGKQQDSIPAQIQAFINYANDRGLVIAERPKNFDYSVFETQQEVEKEFRDHPTYRDLFENVSGLFVVRERKSARKPRKREKWGKLMKMAQKGEIQGILSYAPDRQARNMLEAGELLDLLEEKDFEVAYTNFAFEKNSGGKMMLTMLFGFAKHYSDNRSELSKRGNENKLAKGEALGKGKYGYFVNDEGYYEPHEEYRDHMQVAFSAKLYHGKTDKEIAQYLNEEGFKTIDRVGKRNKDFGKTKFRYGKVNYKNLGKVRIDPFYYGVLVYGEDRSDQRDSNPYYGDPLITKEEHDRLINRYYGHYSTDIKKSVKDENEECYPFSQGVVTDQEGVALSPGIPNKRKRYYPKLEELKRDNPQATLANIVEPHQIKYTYTKKDKETGKLHKKLNINASALIDSVKELLSGLEVTDEFYDSYVEQTKKKLKDKHIKYRHERQLLQMDLGSIESEESRFIEGTLGSVGSYDDKQRESYNNKVAEFERKKTQINQKIATIQTLKRNHYLEAMAFFEFMRDAVGYYERASYVQKRRIADIFILNIAVSDENEVIITLREELAPLFSGMVTDTGLEPVTSAMSMQRSRQLS